MRNRVHPISVPQFEPHIPTTRGKKSVCELDDSAPRLFSTFCDGDERVGHRGRGKGRGFDCDAVALTRGSEHGCFLHTKSLFFCLLVSHHKCGWRYVNEGGSGLAEDEDDGRIIPCRRREGGY